MIGRPDVGPGNYGYGIARELPPKLQNSEVLQTEFWQIAEKFLADSFVVSNGRQYAQFCDMVALTALVDEAGIEVNWDVINSPDSVAAVRSWKLPDSHTRKPIHCEPIHSENLVSGVFEFWWRMQCDAFRWRHDPSFQLLPNEDAIEDRFESCRVMPGETSSSTVEEMASLNNAIGDIRDHEELREASSGLLAARGLQWHLKSARHWLAHKRPRIDGGDIYAIRFRDSMLTAAATPEDQRSLYDTVSLKHVDALDNFLAIPAQERAMHPRLQRMDKLHGRVIKLYNLKHPKDDDITVLHRLETAIAA
jgi:hypothetical protein